MIVPWRALNGLHLTTAKYAKGAEWNRRRMAEEDMRDITERAIQAYGRPLAMVNSFKYLRQVLTAADDYWPVGKFWKERKSWARLARILEREGASSKVSGMFFKVVV